MNLRGKAHTLLNPTLASLMLAKGDIKETNASKSFKEVLTSKSTLSLSSLKIIQSTVKGKPLIFLPNDEIEKLAEPFSFSLIGKFIRDSFQFLKHFWITFDGFDRC